MNGPNKNIKFPLENYDRLCFLKNVVKNPNIIVGDYTYYDDFENVENFEKNVKSANVQANPKEGVVSERFESKYVVWRVQCFPLLRNTLY